MKPEHGWFSRFTKKDDSEISVNLSLVLRVVAMLAGAWLILAGTLFGLRKIVALKESPAQNDPDNRPRSDDPLRPVEVSLSMNPQGYVPQAALPSAHEGSDLDVPVVLKAGALLGLTLVVSIVVLALLFRLFEHMHPARTSEAEPLLTLAELPPPPGVVADPGAELRKVQARENLHLERYDWANPAHTAAQIPIDRAMIIWVETYSSTPQTPPSPQSMPGQPSATPSDPGDRAASAPNAVDSPSTPALSSPPAGATELQMRQEKATERPNAP